MNSLQFLYFPAQKRAKQGTSPCSLQELITPQLVENLSEVRFNLFGGRHFIRPLSVQPNKMKQVESDPTGRYIRYDETLGRGSYKVVYKAFDTHEAMEVAWNHLQVDRIPEKQLSKVRLEVELLKRLDHKNIINLFAAWRGKTSKGKPTMDFITELMSSGTLKEYLTRARAMKLKVIRRWCHNLLEGITYLHAQNPPVMHRDLKCDNIFINGHVGEVKIGDLGLSGVKEDVVAQSVIGTPEFMAPELYEEAYTEKVDIYAFGMCMLEMITMEYPYSECSNPAQIFRKVFSGEKPLSFQRLPPSEIKQVIGACLEREKKRPSASQLLKHPFFADWASDDGKVTNISLNSHRPSPRAMPSPESITFKKGQSALYKKRQSGAHSMRMSMTADTSPKVLFNELKVGQSLCFNSEGLSRDVLVAKEKLHRLISDTEVSVSSANDGGELRIALRIPVDGETKKVEFFFDPVIDEVREIAHEMVQEFDLHDDEVYNIQNDIEQQIRNYQSERYDDEALEDLSESVHVEPSRTERSKDSRDGLGVREARREDRYSSPSQSKSNDPSKNHAIDHSPKANTDNNSDSEGCNSRNDRIYLSEEDVALSAMSLASSSAGYDKNAFKANMALLEHCSKGKYSVVQQKLESGAKADFADYDKRTPLHLAATEGHDKVVEILISYGADIDAEDRWGSTPVDDAKNNGHEHVVDFLVNAGAYVDTRTLSHAEITSMELMQYAANGFYDMVREKLMAGAEAKFADYDKRTPLHLSCAEGHPDVTQLLLINGGDPMSKDRFGTTPVDEAVKNDHDELLELLVRYGGCVPARLLSKEDADYQYGMDLVTHASRGRMEKVRYLIEQGASVGFGDYDRRTALHLACAEGHSGVVLALLKAGADPMYEDRWGVSSFDEAQRNMHEEMIMVMKKFQASSISPATKQKAGVKKEVKLKAVVQSRVKLDE